VKLETSISDREKGRAERAGATKGLAVEEKNAQTELSVFDALVHQALAGENESLRRKWQSVRRIRRRAVNTTSTPAPATQATPTTTSQRDTRTPRGRITGPTTSAAAETRCTPS